MSIRTRNIVFLLTAVVSFGVLHTAHAATVSIDLPTSPITVTKTELQLAISFDTPSVTPPAAAQLTLTVKNTGSATATNVAIDNLLPVEFLYTAGQPTELAQLGGIAPGASLTRAYAIAIPASVETQRYVDEAVASAANADSVEAIAALDVNSSQVLGASDEILATTGGTPIVTSIFGLLFVGFGIYQLRPQTTKASS